MIRFKTLQHQFVRSVPRELEPGVLYVSIDFSTVVHSCCCGCGEQVVTPLTPTDWRMTFDGETVSLHPSVGNWNQKCRSHYVIRQGKVFEAPPWSEMQVEAERYRDQQAKAKYFGTIPDTPKSKVGAETGTEKQSIPNRYSKGRWSKFILWFKT